MSDELSGFTCSECGMALRYTFGGCDWDTDYTCDDECGAHTCFRCIQVHERKHEDTTPGETTDR
jgi:hypothetical protein